MIIFILSIGALILALYISHKIKINKAKKLINSSDYVQRSISENLLGVNNKRRVFNLISIDRNNSTILYQEKIKNKMSIVKEIDFKDVTKCTIIDASLKESDIKKLNLNPSKSYIKNLGISLETKLDDMRNIDIYLLRSNNYILKSKDAYNETLKECTSWANTINTLKK